MSDNTLYDDNGYELKRRPDDPYEDYSLKSRGLYVEFSYVSHKEEHGVRLRAGDAETGSPFASVFRDPDGEHEWSIPEELFDLLIKIGHGELEADNE